MNDQNYKYGAPDDYGVFPYLYTGRYKKAELEDILRERLPESYNMQIVCPVESKVLADCSSLGIDAHLEAITMTQPDRIEDRKIGDRVVQRHHALDVSKEGMICLLRRLKEYDPRQFDQSDLDPDRPSDYAWSEDIKEEYRYGLPFDMWRVASNLRFSILETLQIESFD